MNYPNAGTWFLHGLLWLLPGVASAQHDTPPPLAAFEIAAERIDNLGHYPALLDGRLFQDRIGGPALRILLSEGRARRLDLQGLDAGGQPQFAASIDGSLQRLAANVDPLGHWWVQSLQGGLQRVDVQGRVGGRTRTFQQRLQTVAPDGTVVFDSAFIILPLIEGRNARTGASFRTFIDLEDCQGWHFLRADAHNILAGFNDRTACRYGTDGTTLAEQPLALSADESVADVLARHDGGWWLLTAVPGPVTGTDRLSRLHYVSGTEGAYPVHAFADGIRLERAAMSGEFLATLVRRELAADGAALELWWFGANGQLLQATPLTDALPASCMDARVQDLAGSDAGSVRLLLWATPSAACDRNVGLLTYDTLGRVQRADRFRIDGSPDRFRGIASHADGSHRLLVATASVPALTEFQLDAGGRLATTEIPETFTPTTETLLAAGMTGSGPLVLLRSLEATSAFDPVIAPRQGRLVAVSGASEPGPLNQHTVIEDPLDRLLDGVQGNGHFSRPPTAFHDQGAWLVVNRTLHGLGPDGSPQQLWPLPEGLQVFAIQGDPGGGELGIQSSDAAGAPTCEARRFSAATGLDPAPLLHVSGTPGQLWRLGPHRLLGCQQVEGYALLAGTESGLVRRLVLPLRHVRGGLAGGRLTILGYAPADDRWQAWTLEPDGLYVVARRSLVPLYENLPGSFDRLESLTLAPSGDMLLAWSGQSLGWIYRLELRRADGSVRWLHFPNDGLTEGHAQFLLDNGDALIASDLGNTVRFLQVDPAGCPRATARLPKADISLPMVLPLPGADWLSVRTIEGDFGNVDLARTTFRTVTAPARCDIPLYGLL